jgi:hypothetical protein
MAWPFARLALTHEGAVWQETLFGPVRPWDGAVANVVGFNPLATFLPEYWYFTK